MKGEFLRKRKRRKTNSGSKIGIFDREPFSEKKRGKKNRSKERKKERKTEEREEKKENLQFLGLSFCLVILFF